MYTIWFPAPSHLPSTKGRLWDWHCNHQREWDSRPEKQFRLMVSLEHGSDRNNTTMSIYDRPSVDTDALALYCVDTGDTLILNSVGLDINWIPTHPIHMNTTYVCRLHVCLNSMRPKGGTMSVHLWRRTGTILSKPLHRCAELTRPSLRCCVLFFMSFY